MLKDTLQEKKNYGKQRDIIYIDAIEKTTSKKKPLLDTKIYKYIFIFLWIDATVAGGPPPQCVVVLFVSFSGSGRGDQFLYLKARKAT